MELKEGAVTNSILKQKLIYSNGNLIMVVVGKTGAGKSYWCLRCAELWYKEQFKSEFPIIHVCSTIEGVVKLLARGKIRRGDIIILEEAGTSMNNLEFQNKVSKLFNLVLQTFRNKHICLIMNLPFISLLNKTTRTLMHMQVTMKSLDEVNKISKAKVLHVQVNQDSGKVYRHFPRLLVDGCMEAIPEVSFSMPSKELVDAYEELSEKFKNKMIEDVLGKIEDGEDKTEEGKVYLGEQEGLIYEYIKNNPGKTKKELTELLELSQVRLETAINKLRKKGYDLSNFIKPSRTLEILKKDKENKGFKPKNLP